MTFRNMPRTLGKYRVEGLIAEGGMGRVYRCRLVGEEGFTKRLAVKVITPRLALRDRFRERFLGEARLSASLSHPNLVQVFDFGREGDLLYLVMERVEGWDLATAAAQLRQRRLRIDIPLWRHWMDGILSALSFLHGRGLVHGDVTPSNILVTRDGAVKLSDFGIARRGDGPTAGQAAVADGGWAGKAGYAAPEVVAGEGAIFASDLFSAAVTGAELLLTARLFAGEDRKEYGEQLSRFEPAELRFLPGTERAAAVLLPSLSAVPGARHPDASAFRRALRQGLPEPEPGELAAGWDRIFPEEEGDTVVPGAEDPHPPPGAIVAGEEGARYGRGVRAGVAAALSILAAGSVAAVYLRGNGAGPGAEGRHGGMDPPVAETRFPSGEGEESLPGLRNPPRPADAKVVSPRDDGRGGGGTGAHPLPKRAALPLLPPSTAAGVATGFSAFSAVSTIPSLPAPLSSSTAPSASPAGGAEGPADPGKGAVIPVAGDAGTFEAIQVTPWARVYLGVKSLGVTPIFGASLPTGVQTLRIVNEELGVDRTERVNVMPGENGRLILRLRD